MAVKTAQTDRRMRFSRGQLLAIFFSTFALLIAAGFYTLTNRGVVSTSNAYVSGIPVAVTSQTPGRIRSVAAIDTQEVVAGQVLAMLDDFDLTREALEAKSAVQTNRIAERQARTAASSAGVRIANSKREREVVEIQYRQAQEARDHEKRDYERVMALSRGRWVSDKTVGDSRSRLALSDMVVSQQRERTDQAAANVALSEWEQAQRVDEVQRLSAITSAMQAKFDIAQANIRRSRILAPVSGIVALRRVNPGQRVDLGTTLMQIVPLRDLYVLANFKEDQLAKVKIGDPVRLTSDMYGSSVVFHGKVTGFAGGTGTAFSPIPVVNASGNWVKVTQRLPVRIALNPSELRAHPLRMGLSMSVSVITSN